MKISVTVRASIEIPDDNEALYKRYRTRRLHEILAIEMSSATSDRHAFFENLENASVELSLSSVTESHAMKGMLR